MDDGPNRDLPRPTVPPSARPGATALRGFVPRPRTPLIGRRQDVDTVSALLRDDDIPFVTLIGPGGVGKTRVALQVATEVATDFADGVCVVELASLRDSSLVLPSISRGLGLGEDGGQPMAERIVTFLAARHLLLVLDTSKWSSTPHPVFPVYWSGARA